MCERLEPIAKEIDRRNPLSKRGLLVAVRLACGRVRQVLHATRTIIVRVRIRSVARPKLGKRARSWTEIEPVPVVPCAGALAFTDQLCAVVAPVARSCCPIDTKYALTNTVVGERPSSIGSPRVDDLRQLIALAERERVDLGAVILVLARQPMRLVIRKDGRSAHGRSFSCVSRFSALKVKYEVVFKTESYLK